MQTRFSGRCSFPLIRQVGVYWRGGVPQEHGGLDTLRNLICSLWRPSNANSPPLPLLPNHRISGRFPVRKFPDHSPRIHFFSSNFHCVLFRLEFCSPATLEVRPQNQAISYHFCTLVQIHKGVVGETLEVVKNRCNQPPANSSFHQKIGSSKTLMHDFGNSQKFVCCICPPFPKEFPRVVG